jgi:hypothetical protein
VTRNAAEPVDVAGLHVRNVGFMRSGDVDDFIDIYNQPPLSKYLCLVSQNCAGLPNLRELDFISQHNDEFFADDGSDSAMTKHEWEVFNYYLENLTKFLYVYLNSFAQNFNDTMTHFDTFYYRTKLGF